MNFLQPNLHFSSSTFCLYCSLLNIFIWKLFCLVWKLLKVSRIKLSPKKEFAIMYWDVQEEKQKNIFGRIGQRRRRTKQEGKNGREKFSSLQTLLKLRENLSWSRSCAESSLLDGTKLSLALLGFEAPLNELETPRREVCREILKSRLPCSHESLKTSTLRCFVI